MTSEEIKNEIAFLTFEQRLLDRRQLEINKQRYALQEQCSHVGWPCEICDYRKPL